MFKKRSGGFFRVAVQAQVVALLGGARRVPNEVVDFHLGEVGFRQVCYDASSQRVNGVGMGTQKSLAAAFVHPELAAYQLEESLRAAFAGLQEMPRSGISQPEDILPPYIGALQLPQHIQKIEHK